MVYPKEIINAVLIALAKGTKTSEIKEKYNISLSTIYNWRKKYSAELEVIKVSLEIKKLIKSKNYQGAIALASEERFKDDFLIQSQLITILIKMKDFDKAYNLASEERFKDYHFIQSQLITILIKMGVFDKAYNLACEERFKDSFLIQSQLITILIKMGDFDKAYNLASKERFKDYHFIQSQLITILIKRGDFDKAYNLACEERFINYFPIQSQLITILIKMGDFDRAYNLASEERFKDDLLIQSQLINILIRRNDLDRAYNLASEERFKDYSSIQQQKQKIIKILSQNPKETKSKEVNNSNNFQSLLIAIKNLTMTEDMIINLELYEWQKVILLIAFYEINNYPLNIIIKYLKREIIIYQNNPDVLKILNKLLARIKTKSKLFDIEFYLKLMNISVNFPTTEKDYLTSLANSNNNTVQNPFSRERIKV